VQVLSEAWAMATRGKPQAAFGHLFGHLPTTGLWQCGAEAIHGGASLVEPKPDAGARMREGGDQ